MWSREEKGIPERRLSLAEVWKGGIAAVSLWKVCRDDTEFIWGHVEFQVREGR